jgi:hypothetical protein
MWRTRKPSTFERGAAGHGRLRGGCSVAAWVLLLGASALVIGFLVFAAGG